MTQLIHCTKITEERDGQENCRMGLGFVQKMQEDNKGMSIMGIGFSFQFTIFMS